MKKHWLICVWLHQNPAIPAPSVSSSIGSMRTSEMPVLVRAGISATVETVSEMVMIEYWKKGEWHTFEFGFKNHIFER